MQECGQFDGSLPAEGDHNTDRMFHIDDIQNIFRTERFKIQPVCRIKIRRNRFRIIVHNDDIIPKFPQRPDTVNRGIVKLNSLSDPDRSGSKHHDDIPATALQGPRFT